MSSGRWSNKMWKKLKVKNKTFQKILSRFHFTCEIALNDENLSQFFPDRKVLLMSIELGGSSRILGDAFVTIGLGEQRGTQEIWVICRSPVRFRTETRQLKSTFISAHRPSSKGSKLLFPTIKAKNTKTFQRS